MRLLVLAVMSLAAAGPAMADKPAPKITVSDAQAISAALRNLDGHMVVVKQNGTDNVIMVPWDFGSGTLRLRIANDLSIIDGALRDAESARLSVVKELLKKASDRTGEKVTELKPGTPENDEFQTQFADILASPAAGYQDLARIKASELKLDRNEIPVTVLSALKPIFDDDLSGK